MEEAVIEDTPALRRASRRQLAVISGAGDSNCGRQIQEAQLTGTSQSTNWSVVKWACDRHH